MKTQELILWVSFGLQIVGALIATICYAPGAHKVVKTNDTRSISTPMFILTSCGCVLWIGIGILNMVGFYVYSSDEATSSKLVQTLAAGLGTIISNVGLLTCGMIIFVFKMRNIRLSRKLGWSEEKYFRRIGKYKSWKIRYLREKIKQQNKKKSAK